MHKINYLIILLVGLVFNSCKTEPSKFIIEHPINQLQLSRIDSMPNFPKPFKILDFKNLAKGFDSLVFDDTQTGDYWPLIWKDDSRKNYDQETFGIYTAMGQNITTVFFMNHWQPLALYLVRH